MRWFHSQLQVVHLQKLRLAIQAFWYADFWQQFEQERLS